MRTMSAQERTGSDRSARSVFAVAMARCTVLRTSCVAASSIACSISPVEREGRASNRQRAEMRASTGLSCGRVSGRRAGASMGCAPESMHAASWRWQIAFSLSLSLISLSFSLLHPSPLWFWLGSDFALGGVKGGGESCEVLTCSCARCTRKLGTLALARVARSEATVLSRAAAAAALVLQSAVATL